MTVYRGGIENFVEMPDISLRSNYWMISTTIHVEVSLLFLNMPISSNLPRFILLSSNPGLAFTLIGNECRNTRDGRNDLNEDEDDDRWGLYRLTE